MKPSTLQDLGKMIIIVFNMKVSGLITAYLLNNYLEILGSDAGCRIPGCSILEK
jgi:hypothetical protein